MPEDKTRYPNHFALADLPYFEVRDGQTLALTDASFGPMIDVHTHLALTYGRKVTVDLWQEHERTQHYLPLERELDLDVYINKNFTDEDLSRLRKDLTWKSVRDTGMRQTHTAANLLREMADLGVATSVLLPIDFPVLSWNAESFIDAADRSEHLISLGSVHPYARNVRGKLEHQKELGARGIKVHPAVQMCGPDNKRALTLYRICAELDLPVLFHCGPVGIEPKAGRRRSQVQRYHQAIVDNPDAIFVLGHSGALQMEMGLELAQSYPNVYLELSSQSLTNVRKIIAEGPPDRLMAGSDWPFYHQATALAKILIATDGQPEARRRVLWENAARLFDIDRSLLPSV